ncbi:MAG: ABC transporter ATP-binding protein [Candidatus Limnocylindrales bacterium]
MSDARRILQERVQGGTTMVQAVVRFRGDLLPHWRALGIALLASIAYAATRLLEPWPIKIILDSVLLGMPLTLPFEPLEDLLASDPFRILFAATAAILGLAVLRGFAYYQQSTRTSAVGQDVVMALRRRLFVHLQRLSMAFHNKASTGDLLTRLTGDINMLRELLVSSLLSAVSETVLLVGFVIVMFAMDARLATLAVLVVPVILVMLSIYSGRIRDAASKQRRREGELAGRLQQVLAGMHVVQLFAREDDEEERLRKLNKRSLKSGLKATRLEAQLNRGVELAIAAATAVVLWFGALQVLDGALTPGELIVFVAYTQGFYRPLRRLSRITERASKASSCMDRVLEVLGRSPDVRGGSRVAPTFRGEVRFESVTYGYERKRVVLDGLDLVVETGQTVALVGATGAGKSTLLGLVPRVNDPSAGRVLIDGQDIRSFTLKSLRDQISVVPQDGVLFGGDFLENIRYGRPDATEEEIVAAARAALIHDVIQATPDAYATVIGERGVTLSGGQRQRLAIARAIVKDAPIVLLDEPATGLDAEAEELVMEALDRLLADRTAIIVAHRLATVERADVICVLHAGRIVERGTHSELLDLDGRYAGLYRRQLAPQAAGSGQLPAEVPA